ncbi:SDR family NAD(P)-dependent oxidoreductase, partial [Staphylococcus epidermidis]
ASTGIGAASAKVLANEGAHVLAVDISEKVHDTVKEINNAGNTASGYIVDVSDAHAVERFAQAIKEKHEKIDVLFNNAGVD